jgi:DNA polymerase I-like protein with 3'-5' exonuclease and polymerase domains
MSGSISLFGSDPEPLVKRKEVRLKALPQIPETGWRPPADFPNLSSAKWIGFDTETKDLELKTVGPGWGRSRHASSRKAHIIGVSLAAMDHVGNTGKWYFPIRHEVSPHNNMDVNSVLGYVKHVLENPYTFKVGANIMYDIGNLGDEGINVAGELHDVQFAEAIIDNNARVALDTLGWKYLQRGKTTNALKDWVNLAYPRTGEWRANMYRTPPELAGPYAEDDALMPIEIMLQQGPILEAEDLYRVYRLEMDMIPILIAMRRAGVYVDVDKAERLKLELDLEIKASYEKIYKEYNFALESTDSRQIGKLLQHIGIEFPRNPPSKTVPEGTPKIEKEWLEAHPHPVCELLHDLREMEKMVGTFIGSYILDRNQNGFLYPQFHPLKGETNGTLVGRFASSDPNFQNIPARTKLGKRVRECVIPEPGYKLWRKHDYSQIHYRILAHNAVDKGDGSAERLRQSYINDPDMDYHFNVYQNVAPLMGWDTNYILGPDGRPIPMDKQSEEIQANRRPIKNTNFGLLYGQQEKSLSYKLGMAPEKAKGFFQAYHSGAPYVMATMDAIAAEAERNGYVTTLLGRRIRFDLWEQRGFQRNKGPALPYKSALAAYGSFIQLAGLYRAVNYKFQGSEPDIMKSGMRDLWRSGVFDFVGIPRLTVHDELDWNQRDESPEMEEAFRFVKYTMENAIRLRVPVKVDATKGDNWGKAK